MTTLDARGLTCPLPLALARRRMEQLAPGDILVVLATDPEAPLDLAAWAADAGHAFRALDPRRGAPPGERAWVELELRKGG